MAEAIPEAAEVAGEAGVPGVSEAASPRGPAKSGGRGRIPLPPAGGQRRRGAPPRGGQQLQQGYGRSAARSSRGALKGRLPGTHSYQPVILAEFIVAVVLVSVSPLASGGTANAQAKGSASPYDVNTLKQLVAIGMTYFVLALFGASEKAGRYAAWFGGLVLLGLGFTQLASGDLQAIFGLFSGIPGGAALQDSGGTTGTGSNAAPGPGPTGTPNPSLIDSGITATQPDVSFGPTGA